MKNIKTNAMLLTLGLLVSGSVMHADVTQEAEQLKKKITEIETACTTELKKDFIFLNNYRNNPNEANTKTKPLNNVNLGNWRQLLDDSIIPFIQKEANNFPESAKLKAALETVKNVKNFHLNPDSTISVTTKRDLLGSLKPLTERINALKSETFPFSAGKRAAKDLADHLMNSLGKISAHIIKFISLVEGVEESKRKSISIRMEKLRTEREMFRKATPAKTLSNDELKKELDERLEEYKKRYDGLIEHATEINNPAKAPIENLPAGAKKHLDNKYASIMSQVNSLTQNGTEKQKTLIQDFWSKLNRLHFPNRPAFKPWK